MFLPYMAPKACWGPHQLQLRLKCQSHCLIFTDCAKRCGVYYSSGVSYYFHHFWIITVTTWNEVSLTGTICAMLLTITPTTGMDKCSRTVQNIPLIKISWSLGKWSDVIREFAANLDLQEALSTSQRRKSPSSHFLCFHFLIVRSKGAVKGKLPKEIL